MDKWDAFMSLEDEELQDAQYIIANLMYQWYESYVQAGFNEQQALALTMAQMDSTMNGEK